MESTLDCLQMKEGVSGDVTVVHFIGCKVSLFERVKAWRNC